MANAISNTDSTIDSRSYEVASILRRLADQIEDGHNLVYLNDSNGNPVGVAEFKA